MIPDFPDPTEDERDYDPDWDVDAWVVGLHNEMSECLGPDPTIRLEVAAALEISHIVRGMNYLYGDEGVRVATSRLRESIDVAERNARLNNGGPREDDADLFE